MLQDPQGRTIDYLRIAVTDRCNFRCRYCMPEEGIDFLDRDELLTYEELVRLGGVFRDLGVKKIRITGGEPFVRKDMDVLLRAYTDLFPSVNITTNATLLHNHWSLLHELGLKGLNISIDSLQESKFNEITRRQDFERVYSSILQAKELGLPVKLNMVVMKGINDDEIIPFVEFAVKNEVEVRFIEAMPFNEDDGNLNQFISYQDILQTIESQYSTLEPVESTGPSSSLKFKVDNKTSIGIIPSYSRTLCGTCNRIRLTPQGQILTCLYAADGIDLKNILRSGASDTELSDWIQSAVKMKEDNGVIEEKKRTESIFQSMSSIGG